MVSNIKDGSLKASSRPAKAILNTSPVGNGAAGKRSMSTETVSISAFLT